MTAIRDFRKLKVGGVNLEWNKETELFIILIYYVIPVVILGLVFIGVILLLRNLIRFINNNKKNQRNRK